MARDLLYVLGTGSLWKNNEIRYSIRSAAEYTNFDKIYLVGEKPKWLRPDYYLHVKDPWQHNKPGNIFYKIYKACKELPIRDDVIFMADDYIFNHYQNLDDLRTYKRFNPLWDYDRPPPAREYDRTLYMTSQYLRAKGKGTDNYDLHSPFVIDPRKFVQMAEEFSYPCKGNPGWNVQHRSISWRSCYGNYWNVPAQPTKDFRVYGFEEKSFLEHLVNVGKVKQEVIDLPISEQAENMPFFSMGIPFGPNAGWFEDRHPEKTKYEL